MAYTDLEYKKFKTIFKTFKMIDDYMYRRILLYKPEELSNNLIFEIHLRIPAFKYIYDECYKYIKNVVKPTPKLLIKEYKELNIYKEEFRKFGYELKDIIFQIFNEILLINGVFSMVYGNTSSSKYGKVNLFMANSISNKPVIEDTIQFNDNPFTSNVLADNQTNMQYSDKYYYFIKKFDVYTYEYIMPTNRFFMEESSINVNILLNQNNKVQELQIENILKLIKNIKLDKKNYDIDELIKKDLSDISTYFYLYDLSQSKIPIEVIKRFTFKYITNKGFSELERLKKHLQEIIKLTKEINSKILIYKSKNTIKKEEIDLFSNDINLVIEEYQHAQLINNKYFLPIKFINKNMELYKNLRERIWKIYDKKQIKFVKTLIKRNQELSQMYIDNCKAYHPDKINYKFNLYFSSYCELSDKEIKDGINNIDTNITNVKFLQELEIKKEKKNKSQDLKKEIKKEQELKAKKSYINITNMNYNVKNETINTYINIINCIVDDISKNYQSI